MNHHRQETLKQAIVALREQCQTLVLSTLDNQGTPNVSYAPFLWQQDGYYILISEISRHTHNLQQIPKASMMMIEDESSCRDIFARQRLTFDITAEEIFRHDERWAITLPSLRARHGKTVTMLENMSDFRLFRLIPQQGLYVKGFGQAYQVNADDQVDVVHLETGHTEITIA